METSKKPSKTILWTSYVLQGIIVLMFLMGAIMNLLQTEEAVTGATAMGYPESSVLYLGIVLLFGTLLYAYSKTVIIGAIILTGWLGGAVATHVIHKDPIFNLVFPVIFGIIVWLSIWLRNEKLKALLSN
ncbi:DoxX family protein [Mariniflexile litorale]|uniref:DoxX family protein n=1 Tax=Mariniflexile litorale TaxID=3045158 RepID=A0AAU7EE91_9FLAO|nr:DoxX family protein [Mariniflexile sp. KMM 9835]MDQ8212037.1 DoxX family protein [Mariniflexile sp. KMM 9835]